MADIRYFIPPEQLEVEALEQIAHTASVPCVVHVAVMPDAHFGKGSTVGTVLATRDAVIPAAVGVDIGCGMIAVRTNLNVADVKAKLPEIRQGIERRIPLGIGPYGMNEKISISAASRIKELEDLASQLFDDSNWMDNRDSKWRNALGSLGGGNHFIEICIGTSIEDEGSTHWYGPEEVWVILHSGSRGVGNKTGTFWTKRAQEYAKTHNYFDYLPSPDLAWLSINSACYWNYLSELKWCQKFAELNRDEMMDRVLTELSYTLGTKCSADWCGTVFPLDYLKPIEVERINCHHNFTQMENHHGENLLVTRKGAIEAKEGMRGLIPGSMGACSYIVTGLGNSGSLNSAPHGAGRRMSRSKARKEFTKEGLAALMQKLGIEARVREAIVDEHPDSYKDIATVIDHARELIKPTHILSQLINIKGD